MKESGAFCWFGDMKDILSVSLTSVGKHLYIQIWSLLLRNIFYSTDKLGPILLSVSKLAS